MLLAVVLLGSLGATLATVQAQGQRVEYLVRLLQTSDTFRVRAQAAISLGRVDSSATVVRALSQALGDDHPAVRTAAASSLERLADPSALGALRNRRRDSNAGVRRAVSGAIRTLERVARTQPTNQNNNNNNNNTSNANAEFYVGVGMPGTKQGQVDRDALRRARQFVASQLQGMDGVELAPERESNAAAQRVIQRRRLTGYYIDASIVSVGESGGGTRAVVSVILNTYPGRDMRAILQGAATVPGASGASAEEQAIQGALRGALRRLPQAMAASRR